MRSRFEKKALRKQQLLPCMLVTDIEIGKEILTLAHKPLTRLRNAV